MQKRGSAFARNATIEGLRTHIRFEIARASISLLKNEENVVFSFFFADEIDRETHLANMLKSGDQKEAEKWQNERTWLNLVIGNDETMLDAAITLGYDPNRSIETHLEVDLTALSWCLLNARYDRFMYFWKNSKIDNASKKNKKSLIHGLCYGARKYEPIQLEMNAFSFFSQSMKISSFLRNPWLQNIDYNAHCTGFPTKD